MFKCVTLLVTFGSWGRMTVWLGLFQTQWWTICGQVAQCKPRTLTSLTLDNFLNNTETPFSYRWSEDDKMSYRLVVRLYCEWTQSKAGLVASTSSVSLCWKYLALMHLEFCPGRGSAALALERWVADATVLRGAQVFFRPMDFPLLHLLLCMFFHNSGSYLFGRNV